MNYRSHVRISLGQLRRNLAAVRAAAGVDVAGVVKADAYGHGAIEISRVLEEEGVGWLAVSSVDEGVALRRAGRTARILVMAGFLPYERDALVEFSLTPAAHSAEDIRLLSDLPVAFHLKLDTGLTRLGAIASTARLAEAIRSCTRARFGGLMTHFASPADFGSPQTDNQIHAFNAAADALVAAGLDPAIIHSGSTNAIGYARRGRRDNLVRAGHGIYGYVSPPRGDAPKPQLDVAPILEWRAKILAVKDVPEGALIGYGATFRAPRPLRAGVLAIGYADGLPHRLSNRGRVLAGGKPAPILGTVSMDLTVVDLTAAPHLVPGDDVTILGPGLDAQQIARLAGTISYNVLCGIGSRVHRVYVE